MPSSMKKSKCPLPPFMVADIFPTNQYNILTGRYPCEVSDYIMLGGIQARLELGPYDISTHTPSFIRYQVYTYRGSHIKLDRANGSNLRFGGQIRKFKKNYSF